MRTVTSLRKLEMKIHNFHLVLLASLPCMACFFRNAGNSFRKKEEKGYNKLHWEGERDKKINEQTKVKRDNTNTSVYSPSKVIPFPIFKIFTNRNPIE